MRYWGMAWGMAMGQQVCVVLSAAEREQLAAIVIPPAMGAVADHWGAGQSFVILGTVLIVLCVPVTLITRRAGRTATNPAEPTVGD